MLDRAVDPESAANKGNVERWLLELEAMQWESVRTQVTLSLKEYPTISREQWVLNWPAQAVLGVSQVRTALETLGHRGVIGSVKGASQMEARLDFSRDIAELVNENRTGTRVMANYCISSSSYSCTRQSCLGVDI